MLHGMGYRFTVNGPTQQAAGRKGRGGIAENGLARRHHLGLRIEKHPREGVVGGVAAIADRRAFSD
jgi:hypothetical protein